MKKPSIIKAHEKVVFQCVHQENAKNIAIALCSAGYLVRICRSSDVFLVYIYQQV